MIRQVLFYAALLGITVLMVSSCGGSKQSANMRQIEKHSKRNPIGDDDLPVVRSGKNGKNSKKVRKALAQQQKQKEATEKEAQKAYLDAITRHRELQTPEVRARMDQRLKESNKRYNGENEFFMVRWFRPKDSVEKIEKRRAREEKKRMADSRKIAKKNNEQLGITRAKASKTPKIKKPEPNDMQVGGGGAYPKGKAKKYVNPNDIQQGGGGSYSQNNSKNRINPSDVQVGGGGTYKETKSKKKSTKKK